MKLTRKQTNELWNCHEGVGILAMKVNDDSIVKIEFFVDKQGEIRYLTDSVLSPKLDLNEFVKERGCSLDDNT